jgi:hypothetical protein
MRVAGDYDIESRCARITIQVAESMQHIKPHALDFQESRCRNGGRPVACVVVSANCRHRCDLAQPLEHRDVSYVAGVNDEVAPGESVQRFDTQKPVRVGYDADDGHDEKLLLR